MPRIAPQHVLEQIAFIPALVIFDKGGTLIDFRALRARGIKIAIATMDDRASSQAGLAALGVAPYTQRGHNLRFFVALSLRAAEGGEAIFVLANQRLLRALTRPRNDRKRNLWPCAV